MEKPAESKGLRLILQLDPAVRLAVLGDPVRLRQVLTNLISNALKFTDRGAVSRGRPPRRDVRPSTNCGCDVRDTGIGIARDNRRQTVPRLRPGRRVDDPPLWRHRPGPAICKRIVDLMGGTIGVDSEAAGPRSGSKSRS